MADFSFKTDKDTYINLKTFFQSYESSNSGTGTVFKGPDSKDCFQIKFMEHQSDSMFSSEPMYKVYVRKMKCEEKNTRSWKYNQPGGEAGLLHWSLSR